MFALLVPGVVLAAVVVAASLREPQMFGDGSRSEQIGAIATLYYFVQFGSQVLNAWVILRRPTSYLHRSLRHDLAINHSVMYLTLLLNLAWLGAADNNNVAVLCVPLLATLSFASFFFGVDKNAEDWDAAPLVTVGLSPRARTLWLAFTPLAAASVGSWVFRQLTERDDNFLFDASVFGLMLAGLPWSPSVFVIVASALPSAGEAGNFNPMRSLLECAMLVPVVTNMVIALLVFGSERARTRTANWFFRFGRVRRRS